MKPVVITVLMLTGIGLADAQAPAQTEQQRARALAERLADAGPRRGDELTDLIDRLADSSGMEFVVDPRVRAIPTFFGSTAPESVTYSQLLSILRVHGYIAVRTSGRVYVVPDANARQYPTPVVQDDDASVSDDEIVTRVIAVGSDAAPLVPILRPLLAQHAHLSASGDKLVIVDHYDNARRITEIVAMLNGDAPRRR